MFARKISGFSFIFVLILMIQVSIFSEKVNFSISQIDNSEYPVITAYLNILDMEDNPVQGIKGNQFEIFENNKRVKKFEAVPVYKGGHGISILLAIDTSSSMNGKPLKDSKKAALTFIEKMGDFDGAAIITFDDDVKLVQAFTKDKIELADSIESIKDTGNYTSLYDGIYESISEFVGNVSGRRALIVLTDGEDTKSNLTLDDCIALAKKQNVCVYTIGFGENVVLKPLARISKLSGGRNLYTPEPGTLSNIYLNISEQLKNQYAVRYESKLFHADSGKTELLIKLNYNGIVKKDGISFEIPADYTISGKREQNFINSSLFMKIIFIGTGLLALVLLILIVRRLKSKKICPNCGNEMKNDWTECLFCLPERKSEVKHAADDPAKNETMRIKSIQSSDTEKDGGTVRLNLRPRELAYLIIKEGSGKGRQYQLNQGITTIGRDSGNDIILDDESLSRDHAKIRQENGIFYIRDLATTNGTFVNNENIVDKKLKDNDVITIGNVIFSFKQVMNKGGEDKDNLSSTSGKKTQIRNNKTVLE